MTEPRQVGDGDMTAMLAELKRRELAAPAQVSDRDDLIARILEITKSPQSIPFYQKTIATLGFAVVEGELGELRSRLHAGLIESPAKYFTTLLQKQLAPDKGGAAKRSEEVGSARQGEYHSPSALELFAELKPLPQGGEEGAAEKKMDFPFSTKSIPWATFIGPEFFTLSSNKAKSDRVIAKFRMMGGKVAEVPLIRGRFFPKDEDRGILTTEEGRILGAMECFWVEQGCRYATFGNGSVSCFCQVSFRELARLLGWESFGGKDLAHLKRKTINLKVKGYYLELDAIEEFRKAGLRGYGFSLVDGFDLVDKVRHRLEATTVRVRFSDPYSRQLLARRVVSRPKDMLTMRSELAFLMRLYLEPILMSRGVDGKHSIELLNLIEVLKLPAAGWHKFKSRRKTIFAKAVQELHGMKTTDGKSMDVQFDQGLNSNDFMLVARLRDSVAGLSEHEPV